MIKQPPAGQSSRIDTTDGPPLDFSFKNIRSLQQLIENVPISAPHQENQLMSKTLGQTALNFQEQSKKNARNVGEGEGAEVTEPKLQIVRTIEVNDHAYMELQKKKTVKHDEKNEKKAKKFIHPQTTSLFLRYNKITSMANFTQCVQPVFPNMADNLMWVDLSHNRLVELSQQLGGLKNLKTLYLHANYISSFGELEKVKNPPLLKTLTIHANPLEEYGQFRVLIHAILPQLRKIDSTLLTKRETERAEVLMKSLKKYPVIKSPKSPPAQSENQQDD